MLYVASYCRFPCSQSVFESLTFIMLQTDAPKKETEGLHRILVGTGESIHYGADSVAMSHAMS